MANGNLPGMGFLQRLTNGGNEGGGGSPAAAPGTPPPAATPGGVPPTSTGPNPALKTMPGYSQPLSMFGNMSDQDLAAWMAANGVRQPQGPASNRPAKAPAAPAPKPAPLPRDYTN